MKDIKDKFGTENELKSSNYMDMTRETAIYPDGHAKEYVGLGLNGEAGEVAELIKKDIRDDELNRMELMLELGDVMWYIFRIADEYDIKVADIMRMNFVKLKGDKSQEQLIEEFNEYKKAMMFGKMLEDGLEAVLDGLGLNGGHKVEFKGMGHGKTLVDTPQLPEEVDNDNE